MSEPVTLAEALEYAMEEFGPEEAGKRLQRAVESMIKWAELLDPRFRMLLDE